MGYKNRKFVTILLLLALIVGAVFGYNKISKNSVTNNTPEVKGNAETVNCEEFSKEIDKVIDGADITRVWYLKGEGLNIDYTNILLDIKDDASNDSRKFYTLNYSVVDSNFKGELQYSENSKSHIGKVNLEELKTGSYTLRISADVKNCEYTKYKDLQFNFSYPVYVTWSMDWEGSDVEQKYLDAIVLISSKYNAPITHFFNPYIYISLPAERSKYLTDWILRRSNSGDSIGLHLHMHNKLVEAAGVTPQTTAWGDFRANGYDVPNLEYGYDDYKKIVLYSKSLLEQNGLPDTSMFRAGGWYIDEENLRVLDDLGFVLDSSGRQSYQLGKNKLQGPWTLSSTTQPYKLNSFDQNITNNPNMSLWEVPNNGADSWAFNGEQMIGFFKDNYKGGTSTEVKVVTYLSHPHWFNVDNPKMILLFDYISAFTISSDKGPVIFTTIDKLPMVSENN